MIERPALLIPHRPLRPIHPKSICTQPPNSPFSMEPTFRRTVLNSGTSFVKKSLWQMPQACTLMRVVRTYRRARADPLAAAVMMAVLSEFAIVRQRRLCLRCCRVRLLLADIESFVGTPLRGLEGGDSPRWAVWVRARSASERR